MSEAEIIALLSAIGSINWTDAMTHTQHELPPMSDEKIKIGSFGLIRQARWYARVKLNVNNLILSLDYGLAIIVSIVMSD